jgi:PncC family amidohydrolase
MNDVLVQSIQQLCIAQQWTLSLAESCTGGHLAARLTRTPGCSHYFLGSIIAYSNALKTSLLNVNAHTLAQYGAVSEPVVSQMAQGVLKLTNSHYSLAVSGIAGPGGGSTEKPVGTIWGAMATKGEDLLIWNFHLSGTREEIIEKSVELLLSQFWLVINTKR